MHNVGPGGRLKLFDGIFETRCLAIFLGLQNVFEQFSDVFDCTPKLTGIVGCAKKSSNSVLCGPRRFPLSCGRSRRGQTRWEKYGKKER